MTAYRLSPVCLPVTTAALTGLGTIAIKVPGTFSGLTDMTNSRYLKSVSIHANTIAAGDYVDGIILSDDDGVIPVPARAALPDYPTVYTFSTDTGVATGSKAGYYLDNNGEIDFTPFTGEPQQLPSGLYLKATINNAGLLSKTYRVNVVWGKTV